MIDRPDRHQHSDEAHTPPGTCLSFDRCTTRSRKILQFKHYCTDAPI